MEADNSVHWPANKAADELLWLVKGTGKPMLWLVKKAGKKHKNLLEESKLLPRVAALVLVLLPLRLLPPPDPDSSPPTSPAAPQGLHHPLVLLQVLRQDSPDVEEGEEDVDLLLLRQQLGGRLPCLELLCSHRQEPDEILEIMCITDRDGMLRLYFDRPVLPQVSSVCSLELAQDGVACMLYGSIWGLTFSGSININVLKMPF